MSQGFINFSLGPDASPMQGGAPIPLPPLEDSLIPGMINSLKSLMEGLPGAVKGQIAFTSGDYVKHNLHLVVPIHGIKGKPGMFCVPALYSPPPSLVGKESWHEVGLGVQAQYLKGYFAAVMEMDSGSLGEQWGRLMSLPLDLRPTLVCFSGNKSLHAFWGFTGIATPKEMIDLQLALQSLLEGDIALTRNGQRCRAPGYARNDRKQPVIYFEKRFFNARDFTDKLLALVADRKPDSIMDIRAKGEAIRKGGGKFKARFFPPKGVIYEAFLAEHKAGGTTSLKINPNGDLVQGRGASRKTRMSQGVLTVTDFSPDGAETYIFSDGKVKRDHVADIIDCVSAAVAPMKATPPEEETFLEEAQRLFESFLSAEAQRLKPPTSDNLLPEDFFQQFIETVSDEERKSYDTGCYRGLWVQFAKTPHEIAEVRTPCWSHSCERCHPSLAAATLLGARKVLKEAQSRNLLCHTHVSQTKVMQPVLSNFCKENPDSFFLWLNINDEFHYLLFTPIQTVPPSNMTYARYANVLDALSILPEHVAKPPKGKMFRMLGGSPNWAAGIREVRDVLVGRKKARSKAETPVDPDALRRTYVSHGPMNVTVLEREILEDIPSETAPMRGGGEIKTFQLPEFLESKRTLSDINNRGGLRLVRSKPKASDLATIAQELNQHLEAV